MEWKYTRKGVVKNVAIGVAVASAVIALLAYKRSRNSKDRELFQGAPL